MVAECFMKKKLLGLTLSELTDICHQEGLPGFTARQICDWLYKKRVAYFEQMTNLSKKARQALSEKYEVGAVPYCKYAMSKDGTRKYLFEVRPLSKATGVEESLSSVSTASYVEAVMIPDGERKTLCVSSQAGCRMGCRFCMTGRQGFHGNLDAAQILSQFFLIDEAEELTNAVFMGMGEPLDNLDNVLRALDVLTSDWGCAWSPKRITLSTIGVNKASGEGRRGVEGKVAQQRDSVRKSPLERFLEESRVHLAVSLHNPFPDERRELMPSEGAFPLKKTLEIIRRYDFTGQRRVSFEYIMFKGLTDTPRHAEALVSLLRGLECRVNLIRFHDIGDTEFVPSSMKTVQAFEDRLNAAGIKATLRASRGQDIEAACGMLSGKEAGAQMSKLMEEFVK